MSEGGQPPPSKKICVRSSALSIQPAQSQDKASTTPEKKRKLPTKKSPSEKENKTEQQVSSQHSINELPWVDKYKPKAVSQLVGMHDDKSPFNKLVKWLKEWPKYNLGEGKKIKLAKPPPYMAGIDGRPFKAVLLSGSPGVGKTTCAIMVCQHLGFKYIELNASDVRSKKSISAKVPALADSHQIDEYLGAKAKDEKMSDLEVHHVLIMDEVDGMSGNEDRAGISELISIIKNSRIPIICICNDRQNQKMRSLVNHCFDIRFPKPKIEQIRSRMMTICSQEKLKITPKEIDEIIELSDCDVRQTIYNLQLRAASGNDAVKGGAKKNVAIDVFTAARRMVEGDATFAERTELFFVDYGIMPLFVQENYVNMKNPKHSKLQALKGLRKAADFISLGDLVEKKIRSDNAWKLLNEQSMFSAAFPCAATGGTFKGRLEFPTWLGKNSTQGKRFRLLRQVASHSHLKVTGNAASLAMDYLPVWRERLVDPLVRKEAEGVSDVMKTIVEYNLIKDDMDAIGELANWPWPNRIDPTSKILPKVKAALTRAINKEHRLLPYALEDISKKRGAKSELKMDEEGNWIDEDDDEEDDDDEDSGGKSSEVVVKKPAAAGASGSASGRGGRGASRGAARGGGAKARGGAGSSSAGTGRGRGRGRGK
ncbi:hypothetical protein WR25_22594 [Diploscapter pachys]|uniref:AAA+ ATPase domain-containing protein n=1 Tax=Diploscapter pachys TaxID=2018661 RepID=A0A2A2KJH2_9BILA|nr:hypothetical protein WR25_22594 [Diploscapter pachys]